MDDFDAIRTAMSEDMANPNEGFSVDQIESLEDICDNIINYVVDNDDFTKSEKIFTILANYDVAKKTVRSLSKISSIQPIKNTVGKIEYIDMVKDNHFDPPVYNTDIFEREVDIKYHNLNLKLLKLDENSTMSVEDAEDERAWVLSRQIATHVVNNTLNELKALPIFKTITVLDFLKESNGITKYLYTINAAKREVGIRSKRGDANFMIAHPNLAKQLEAVEFFESSFENIEDIQPGDLCFAGTYNKTVKVFCTRHMDDKIVLGYMDGLLDSGYCFSHYLPVVLKKDSRGNVQLFTADAMTMINPDYFQVLEAHYPFLP